MRLVAINLGSWLSKEFGGNLSRIEIIAFFAGFGGKHATCGALVLVYKMLSR